MFGTLLICKLMCDFKICEHSLTKIKEQSKGVEINRKSRRPRKAKQTEKVAAAAATPSTITA